MPGNSMLNAYRYMPTSSGMPTVNTNTTSGYPGGIISPNQQNPTSPTPSTNASISMNVVRAPGFFAEVDGNGDGVWQRSEIARGALIALQNNNTAIGNMLGQLAAGNPNNTGYLVSFDGDAFTTRSELLTLANADGNGQLDMNDLVAVYGQNQVSNTPPPTALLQRIATNGQVGVNPLDTFNPNQSNPSINPGGFNNVNPNSQVGQLLNLFLELALSLGNLLGVNLNGAFTNGSNGNPAPSPNTNNGFIGPVQFPPPNQGFPGSAFGTAPFGSGDFNDTPGFLPAPPFLGFDDFGSGVSLGPNSSGTVNQTSINQPGFSPFL